MKITRENYELWFLDYLDGNLDPEMEPVFNDFLAKNPDLATELESITSLVFLPEKTEFKEKNKLKKSVYDDQETFDNFAIALLEGDLAGKEKIDFENWLEKHPEKQKELGLFSKTKIVPDKSIRYLQKSSLKKRVLVIPLWARVASVAAMLTVALLLFSKKKEKTFPPETITAKVEIENQGKTSSVVIIPERPNEKIATDIKSKASSTKKAEIQSGEKLPASENTGKIAAVEPRDQGIILAELPRKSVIFEFVDELRVTRKTNRDSNQMDREVELSELLKPQLAAIRKSEDMELLSSDHLALSGLQLVAKISGNRLTAKRTAKGEVKSVSFNTHLLAFSIPVKK
jgi:hypothetical protein